MFQLSEEQDMAKHPDTLCSLQNLTVSFSEFQQCPGLILTGFQVSLSKLDWGSTIIAPISYQANYCAGTCTFPLSKVSNYIICTFSAGHYAFLCLAYIIDSVVLFWDWEGL